MAKRKMNYWPAWTFFNEILNGLAWEELKVLDFGGSWGNIIRDKNSTIRPENYWCVDMCKECLDTGKEDFPQSHWIYYNRWNIQYNPGGIPYEPLPVNDVTFDVIAAYSVFTHTSRKEMHDTILKELLPLLKKNGKCIFTFYTTTDLSYCLTKYSDQNDAEIEDLVNHSKNFINGFYLLDNRQLVDINEEIPYTERRTSLTSFYKPGTLLRLFAGYSREIVPGTEKRQHAIIIKN
jgi:ubiquinone/menaquinone biosynthesis C-methylase UbiE